MRLSQQRLERGGQLLGAVSYTFLVLAAFAQSRTLDPYPRGVVPVVLAIAGVLVVLLWVEVKRRPGGQLMGTVFFWFGLAVTLLHLPLIGLFRGQSDPPALIYFCLACMGYAAVAFPPAPGRVAVVGFSLFFGALRAMSVAPRDGVSDGAIMLIAGLGLVELVRVANAVAVDIDRSSRRSWQLKESLAGARRRAFERQRWNGLIHDKILGALLAATREPRIDENSTELAHQALDALGPGGWLPSTGDLSERIAAAASRIGLDLTIVIDGTEPSPLVADTLVEAVTEALTNVARHSGTRQAVVRGHVDPMMSKITVTDAGSGFATDRVRERRAGVRQGIVGRMESVGGTAKIDSRPGVGTRVTLVWEDAEVHATGPEWDIALMRPLLIIMSFATLEQVGVAWVFRDAVRNPGVWETALLACLVMTAVLVLVRRSRWPGVLAALAMVATPAVVTPLLPNPGSLDWQYWWGGGYATAVGVLCFRYRNGVGVAVMAAMMAVDAVVSAGSLPIAGLPWNYTLMTVVAIFASILRRTLDDAAIVLSRAAAREGRSRMQLIEDQARVEEADARRAELSTSASPLLQRIVAGGSLTDAERLGMERAEAEIRDQLVADLLVDADMRVATRRARDRGVRVELVARDEDAERFAAERLAGLAAGGAPEAAAAADCSDASAGLEAFRTLLPATLPLAPDDSRLAAHWSPANPRWGSIVIVGRVPQDAVAAIRDAAAATAGRLSTFVDDDEDSVLVECSSPAGAAPLAVPS